MCLAKPRDDKRLVKIPFAHASYPDLNMHVAKRISGLGLSLTSARKMMFTRIVSMKFLFRHQAHKWHLVSTT